MAVDYSQVQLNVWSAGPGGSAPPGTILNVPHELVEHMVAVGSVTVIEDDPYNEYNPILDENCVLFEDLAGTPEGFLLSVTDGITYNTYV